METTSESAFRPKPAADREEIKKKNMLQSSIQLEGQLSILHVFKNNTRYLENQQDLLVQFYKFAHMKDYVQVLHQVMLKNGLVAYEGWALIEIVQIQPNLPSPLASTNVAIAGAHSFMTTHREDFRVADFQPYPSLLVKRKTPTTERGGLAKEREHVTLYQWDFPPPQHTHRKSTPAVPQPDNLGINPSLRQD